MVLYVVRHGETDWNKVKRVQGHTDIPLNEYGRHLARETAKGLKETRIDLAITSPLIRAKRLHRSFSEQGRSLFWKTPGSKRSVLESMRESHVTVKTRSAGHSVSFQCSGEYIAPKGQRR